MHGNQALRLCALGVDAAALDDMIKATGHQNAIFPSSFRRVSSRRKRSTWKDSRRNAAVVTHGGGKKLKRT